MQPRNPNNARGVDVSNNNGPVDFAQLKRDGFSFVFVKATEGHTFTDPTFEAKYKAAKSAGLIRGAYCFARPRTSAAIETADHFVDTVEKAGGFDELPPVLDMEDAGGLSATQLSAWILSWMARVYARTNKRPMLYSYTSFIQTYGLEASRIGASLWIADYGVTQPPDVGGWSTWKFWQYSSQGKVNGINGNVDVNEFAGTEAELKTWLKIGRGVETVDNAQVKQLQTELARVLGNKLQATGVMDSATVASVKAFQQINKLKVDGIAGPITMNALRVKIGALDAIQKVREDQAKAKADAQQVTASPQAISNAKLGQAINYLQQAISLLDSLK